MRCPTHSRDREQPTCYPARLLERPRATAQGIEHRRSGETALLPWSAVRGAVAAEVGEPEGVRTIVFDLLVRDAGGAPCVHRLGADPGPDAMALARAVQDALGAERKIPWIRSLATDGIPARWYPDLESFEADAAAELGGVLAVG